MSTALGDPGDLIGGAYERGMLVISMVTTVEEAVRVAERGADVVVAQPKKHDQGRPRSSRRSLAMRGMG